MRTYTMGKVAAAACVALAIVGSLDCKPGRAQDTDIAVAWTAAWNSHDPDAVVAVFTGDAVYEDVPFGLVSRGSAEIRAFADFFFTVSPDLKVELVNSSVLGSHGFMEWVFSGTDVGIFGTGKTYSVRGATVIDLEGDKIARNSDYYDLATILKQLGLLPP